MLQGMMLGAGTLCAGSKTAFGEAASSEKKGAQRLSIDQLKQWEALRYGMFICFDISTYVANEFSDGRVPASTYAPDRLDVDQWIGVARDAGMTYAVLTAKHVAGFCLWPSKHTDYTVANSGCTTDVVEKFVHACEKRGVKPGLYYCSWDNHNRFGSRTPSDLHSAKPPADDPAGGRSYTTSLYQDFQTAQITELLTQYGPIMETWIDIPRVLGRGYRTFLYRQSAALQPETVILMNHGLSSGETFRVDRAWPTDIITIEKRLPPEPLHRKWRTIEGKDYYIPGEVCDTIGKKWFFFDDDPPRPDTELAELCIACRQRSVNLLLSVPPDKHGLIPDVHIQALTRLRRNARL